MPKAKLDMVSDTTLRQIVVNSSSFQEVLEKMGYKQKSDSRVITRLKERCVQLKISLEHLSNDKKCNICGCIKPISEYYVVSGKTLAFCKSCQKEKEKKRYKEKAKKLINFKKTLQCKKCGEKRFYLFDFHHRNPDEKDYSISDNPRASLESIQDEIAKCDVLCSNCHREWHYLNRENPSLSYEDWINGKINK